MVWDDQDGDTLQLKWIPELSSRVQRLRLWLRPALVPLVRQRFTAEQLALSRWAPNNPGLRVFCGWNLLLTDGDAGLDQVGRDGGRSYLRGDSQPEQTLQELALCGAPGVIRLPSLSAAPGCAMCPGSFLPVGPAVEEGCRASLVVAVGRHEETQVKSLIENGVLEQVLYSPDWLQTAQALESLDCL